jgi:hypothetical protein
MKIDKIEFTETFPRRIVQIKRFPLFLTMEEYVLHRKHQSHLI